MQGSQVSKTNKICMNWNYFYEIQLGKKELAVLVSQPIGFSLTSKGQFLSFTLLGLDGDASKMQHLLRGPEANMHLGLKHKQDT